MDSEVGIVVDRSHCALPESREICVWGHPATRQGRAFQDKGVSLCKAAGCRTWQSPLTASAGWGPGRSQEMEEGAKVGP